MDVLFAASPLVLNRSDLAYVISISVICTILAMAVFVNSFVNFESRFVQWFSHITSQPRWFTIWILVVVLWVPLRHLLIQHDLLKPDADFVVATVLWSVIPFMVENLLKSTSAKQMAVLTDLILSIREEIGISKKRDDTLTELVVNVKSEIDRSNERDDTLHALLLRLLEVLTDRG